MYLGNAKNQVFEGDNEMTKIIEMLPQLLADSFPQKKDLKLLRVFVKAYNEGGVKAVKEQIESLVNEILEGNKL